MNLVQSAPKKTRFVAEAMPPIIDKGREHVGKGGGRGVWQRGRDMEKRPVGQPVIPGLPSQEMAQRSVGVTKSEAMRITHTFIAVGAVKIEFDMRVQITHRGRRVRLHE